MYGRIIYYAVLHDSLLLLDLGVRQQNGLHVRSNQYQLYLPAFQMQFPLLCFSDKNIRQLGGLVCECEVLFFFFLVSESLDPANPHFISTEMRGQVATQRSLVVAFTPAVTPTSLPC